MIRDKKVGIAFIVVGILFLIFVTVTNSQNVHSIPFLLIMLPVSIVTLGMFVVIKNDKSNRISYISIFVISLVYFLIQFMLN
jgi:cytochrome bd-type quinol oxidase subunit 2